MELVNKHTRTISGITYTTTLLPASRGLVIAPKLIALFGSNLLGLLLGLAQTEEEGEAKGKIQALLEDPKVLGAVVAQVAGNAAEEDGLLILRDMLATTEADLVKIGDAQVPGSVHVHFDQHFAGRLKHLFEVCLWVGQLNFFGL